MDGWMDGWMDGRTDGRTDGRRDGWMDGWMDGCMDGWIVKPTVLQHPTVEDLDLGSQRLRVVEGSREKGPSLG